MAPRALGYLFQWPPRRHWLARMHCGGGDWKFWRPAWRHCNESACHGSLQQNSVERLRPMVRKSYKLIKLHQYGKAIIRFCIGRSHRLGSKEIATRCFLKEVNQLFYICGRGSSQYRCYVRIKNSKLTGNWNQSTKSSKWENETNQKSGSGADQHPKLIAKESVLNCIWNGKLKSINNNKEHSIPKEWVPNLEFKPTQERDDHLQPQGVQLCCQRSRQLL